MVERKIVTLPFEEVTLNLVGPLEKSRRGYRYLLTHICMASRWPHAVPVKSIMTRAVLDTLVEIFIRNGIPKVLLSDESILSISKHLDSLPITLLVN